MEARPCVSSNCQVSFKRRGVHGGIGRDSGRGFDDNACMHEGHRAFQRKLSMMDVEHLLLPTYLVGKLLERSFAWCEQSPQAIMTATTQSQITPPSTRVTPSDEAQVAPQDHISQDRRKTNLNPPISFIPHTPYHGPWVNHKANNPARAPSPMPKPTAKHQARPSTTHQHQPYSSSKTTSFHTAASASGTAATSTTPSQASTSPRPNNG
jgi:hypothetical protein